MKLVAFLTIVLFAASLQAASLVNGFFQINSGVDANIAHFSEDGESIFFQDRKETQITDLDGNTILSMAASNEDTYFGSVGLRGCEDYLAVGANADVDGSTAVRIYKTDGSLLQILKPSPVVGTYGDIHRLQFNKDCTKLLISGYAPTTLPADDFYKIVRIYDVLSGKLIYSKDFTDDINTVVSNDDLTKLVILGWQTFSVIEVSSDQTIYEHKFSINVSDIYGTFMPGTNNFVTVTEEGFMLHDLDAGKKVAEWASPVEPNLMGNNDVQVFPTDPRIIVTKSHKEIILFNVATQDFKVLPTSFDSYVQFFCINKDATKILAVGQRDQPSLIDIASGKIDRPFEIETAGWLHDCDISKDASHAVIAGYQGVRLYTLPTK